MIDSLNDYLIDIMFRKDNDSTRKLAYLIDNTKLITVRNALLDDEYTNIVAFDD